MQLSMVETTRWRHSETGEELAAHYASAMAQTGPRLIEVML
jgi:hypothetical protein